MSSAPMSERPRIFNFAWPLLVELLLAVTMGVVGTALAARISDDTVGAFAISNQVSQTVFMLFRVIGAGVSVVVAQNLGAGQRDASDRVARAVLGASTWLGGISGIACLIWSHGMLNVMNTPAELMPLAVMFLMALVPAMWLDAWNASMASVMRAHLRTRDTLVVLVAMHLSHILLAIPLMFGLWIIPPLGLLGFALALAISRTLGLILHTYMWKRHLDIHPILSDWWRLPRRELSAVLHIGLPGAAEGIMHRVCFMATISVTALFGAKAIATHAYVMQLLGFVSMCAIAIGFSVEILVGHMIGSGDLNAAHKLVRKSLMRGLILAFILATCVALFGKPLLGLFTKDPEILRLGYLLLWFSIVLELGRTFNIVVINALRATGDANYPLLAGMSSMIIIMGGGSWLLGSYFGLGLFGVWISYTADEWTRGMLMWRRWSVHGWVPYAKVARRRFRTAF
jgi:putative MATE family efflux protein